MRIILYDHYNVEMIFVSEWLENLPEELRDVPFLSKADNAKDAAAKLHHAAKLVGTSIKLPDDKTSDEDRQKFYERLNDVPGVAKMPESDDIEGVVGLLKKLGYPEDHTGYKLPEIADFEWNEDMADQLRKYAHESGMTPGQFTAFASRIAGQEHEADQTAEAALHETQKALRLDWGDTLEDREALIRGWLTKSDAPESLLKGINDRSLDVGTMNWLHSVAKEFKDETTPISNDGKLATSVDPGEARVKIPEILDQLVGMSEADPRYRKLQADLVEMQTIASGGEAA